MNIITRAQAIGLGLKRFYTAKPCKQGHIAERYVTTGGCLSCVHPWRKDNGVQVQEIPLPATLDAEVRAYLIGVLLPREMQRLVVQADEELRNSLHRQKYRADMLTRAGNMDVCLAPTEHAQRPGATPYYDGEVDGYNWKPWELVDAGLFIWIDFKTKQPVTD